MKSESDLSGRTHVRVEPHRLLVCLAAVSCGIFFCANLLASPHNPTAPQIPSNFKLDMETAARLRPELLAESVGPTGRYALGRMVFDRLLMQFPKSRPRFAWQLRIVEDGQFNAYASPDGTVYVESGLAQLAGPSAGLWAALLSHEIAHVVRRDWARRYLYQQSLESGGALTIVLGDPGFLSGSWTDSHKASGDLALFCRQMEVEADREGLMLMARSGYHPDFVPALHHLLHAQGSGTPSESLYAMHPCWEERDHELSRAYTEATIEFAHGWPEWYASPGGNPPVVVFAEVPTVKKTNSSQWQIDVPLRCQNLAGAVEVVLRAGSRQREMAPLDRLPEPADSDSELRQITGCTSPRTTITFTFADSRSARFRSPGKSTVPWTDIYVVDAWGTVLARADVPKPPR